MNSTALICTTIVTLGLLLSACGPSKETMCKKIADYRSQPSDTSYDVAERYIKCLNAPDSYAKRMYKEIEEGGK